MSLNLTTEKSNLLQVMALCYQATSYSLSHCWPWSLSWYGVTRPLWINTLRPRQNGRHFPDIFKGIFLNENVWILIKISLKFVSNGPINNIPALVQIMAWHWPGDKPLSETMISLPTHICVTWPQWVKICCRDYIVMITDALAPNWCQGICNHHDGYCDYSFTGIIL